MSEKNDTRDNNKAGSEGRSGAEYVFRHIKPSEADQAADMEQICFPPNEACTPEMMIARVNAAPGMFTVAEYIGDGAFGRESEDPVGFTPGRLAGMITGLSTDEDKFRDEFFSDVSLFKPGGKNIMILGVEVLPEHRGRGLARQMMEVFASSCREAGASAMYLTCLEGKVEMYKKMGFVDLGMSASCWGGENWHEMKREL